MKDLVLDCATRDATFWVLTSNTFRINSSSVLSLYRPGHLTHVEVVVVVGVECDVVAGVDGPASLEFVAGGVGALVVFEHVFECLQDVRFGPVDLFFVEEEGHGGVRGELGDVQEDNIRGREA